MLDTERCGRVDDVAMLVELVSTGWKSVEERLARLEEAVAAPPQGTIHHLEQRRAAS